MECLELFESGQKPFSDTNFKLCLENNFKPYLEYKFKSYQVKYFNFYSICMNNSF